jgi:DNA topoisomerase I
MIDLDPKIKKKKGPEFFELPEGIDQDWIKMHQAACVEEQRQKIQKKFEKDNEKRVADGEREMKASELQERLQAVTELENKFNKENKTGKVEAEGKGPTIEKLEAALEKLAQRIEVMKLQVEDKDNNKEVALGTSKIVRIPDRFLGP